MKVKTFMLLILICMVGISGCADYGNGDDTMPSDGEGGAMADDSMDDEMAEPDAATLFSEITVTDNYKGWSIWPGKEAMMDGSGVHGDYVTIYVSDNAVSSAEMGGEMPYGTMVVKEGFNADEELIGVYLMYKVEDYNPEDNDWFWAAYSPEGNVNSEGTLQGCINCHKQVQDADYIYANA